MILTRAGETPLPVTGDLSTMITKYTYWMTEPETHQVRETMENLGINVFEAKKAVCVPLSKKHKLSIVDPSAWSSFDICKRQLSWYGTSAYNGLFLVVSDEALTTYGIDAAPSTIITESDFKPNSLPKKNSNAITRLSQHPMFVNKCPEAFNDIDDMDPTQQDRWMKIMGVRGISYEDLFVIHCANHSNFIEPEFYTQTEDGIAPYSIGKTNRSCSACLQFFNIIGEEFKTKYVVPCPGAVVFAGLKVNRYYNVTSPKAGKTIPVHESSCKESVPSM